ncbi:MAG: hypothetical protein EOO08_03835 [Chitinophagaceae bacterium]|nr:MAG: hypothetical protein EOO08_03835 [Chitinophagaceae bacterium]
MKSATTFLLLAAIALLGSSCKSTGKQPSGSVYKGRLEVKALCMNYTIALVEGQVDTSMVASTWVDESTGKSYTNAFRLGSPCTFPASINAGDEFYFVIDSSSKQDCAVCMAYYPTPAKALPIRVVPRP